MISFFFLQLGIDDNQLEMFVEKRLNLILTYDVSDDEDDSIVEVVQAETSESEQQTLKSETLQSVQKTHSEIETVDLSNDRPLRSIGNFPIKPLKFYSRAKTSMVTDTKSTVKESTSTVKEATPKTSVKNEQTQRPKRSSAKKNLDEFDFEIPLKKRAYKKNENHVPLSPFRKGNWKPNLRSQNNATTFDDLIVDKKPAHTEMCEQNHTSAESLISTFTGTTNARILQNCAKINQGVSFSYRQSAAQAKKTIPSIDVSPTKFDSIRLTNCLSCFYKFVPIIYISQENEAADEEAWG